MYEAVYHTYIEQTSVVSCQLLYTCMVRRSISINKEGREVPGPGDTDDSIKSPVSWTPPPPSRPIRPYLLGHAAGAKGSSTGVLRTTSDGTELLSCVHACTVPAVTTPHAFGEVPTRQSMAQHIQTHTHTNITTHHSTAQHNTTQPRQFNPVQYNTHNIQRIMAPLVPPALQHSAAQLSDVGSATHTTFMRAWTWPEESDPVSLQPTQTTTSPSSGPDSLPPKSLRPRHGNTPVTTNACTYGCIPRSQPAPGRQGPAYKDLDYRQGEPSNLITGSLWLLWLLFSLPAAISPSFVTAMSTRLYSAQLLRGRQQIDASKQ